MAYVSADLAQPGTDLTVDVRGKQRPARVSQQAPLQEGRLILADARPAETIRTTCSITRSTTGSASRATRPPSASRGTRRTRSARSSSSTRPTWAPKVGKDKSYAEVESVKAVSDVIAPLSGEVTAVNEAVSETPELINEDPYDAGWLVRVQAQRSLRDRRSCCAPRRTGLQLSAEELRSERDPLHVRHRARPRADARGDRRRARSTSCSRTSRRRAARPAAGAAGRHAGGGGVRAAGGARGAQRERRGRDQLPRRRACTTTTCRRSSTRSRSGRSS